MYWGGAGVTRSALRLAPGAADLPFYNTAQCWVLGVAMVMENRALLLVHLCPQLNFVTKSQGPDTQV